MKKDRNREIKLLAPAGDYECFIAAIRSGADAVYAGGNKFGARAYAANFSEEELLRAADYAHLLGRKLYLTVNTVLKNNEISDLYDYIKPLYEGGIDGVIVQDMGVISVLKEYFPELSLHASTQMAVTGKEGVWFLEEMGIKRVVPARELSLEEIKEIHEKTDMEIECFIHGAMCYSYSGKCLFSSIVGGRSGNRGRCAQPCRLPYNDKFILSARDISTIEILPDLIEAGISSFKIEGRMKSKEYVAGVTGIYRKYIDRYLELSGRDRCSDYLVDDKDISELDELYTRSGHCSGYYKQKNGRDMITVNKPSYNTADESRMKALYDKYTGCDLKLKCKGTVKAYAGEELYVSVEYNGARVECFGDRIECAKKQPTSEGNIIKQFNKTGDTPYKFESLDIDCGNDIFIPVSALNSLRRRALDLLMEKMTKPFKKESYTGKRRETASKRTVIANETVPLINVRLDNPELLDTVLKWDFSDIISIDFSSLEEDSLKRVADRIHEKGKSFFLVFPSVIRHGFFERNKGLADILLGSLADGVIIDNYESLYYLGKIGYKGTVTGDVHLYCTNDPAVSAYNEYGIDVLTYPVELNQGELNHLDMARGEFILYGRAPMMVSAQCTQKTTDKCLRDNGISHIKDRFGNVFPVVRSCGECYNTILNCVPTMVASKKEIPSRLSPHSYRIHFTVENKDETVRILDFYRAFFLGEEKEAPVNRTLLHLKRGVE